MNTNICSRQSLRCGDTDIVEAGMPIDDSAWRDRWVLRRSREMELDPYGGLGGCKCQCVARGRPHGGIESCLS